MIRWLLHRQINRLEKGVGVSVDYLRQLLRVSLSGFLKFGLIGPAAAHRRYASRDMIHAARIIAARHEDCGPCVQIAVNLARRDNMRGELLQAILDGRPETTPPSIRLACDFAQSVVKHDGRDDEFRQQLCDQFGEAVIVELSLAIAMARVFPTLKRGMGYATSCCRVAVSAR